MNTLLPPTTADETERLADLVRRQHDSLDTMLLQPAGQFQVRTVALDTLTREVTDCFAEDVRHRDAEDLPMLYCAWGKCRVGSTPLTNLFGVAGMPSYYQPLKANLRDALADRPGTPWIVPSAMDQPHIFSKETAGPYVLAESLFMPLRSLIEAGYPPDKLHLIMLDRDPASSLASWLDKWSDRAPESTLPRSMRLGSKATPGGKASRLPITSMKRAKRRSRRFGFCSTALALPAASLTMS
jgi:hypothetical protein